MLPSKAAAGRAAHRSNRLCATLAQADHRNITDNWFAGDAGKLVHAEEVVVAEAKGQRCFDWDFYKLKNHDVAAFPQEHMWRHFLSVGATQFREHRWLTSDGCPLDVDKVIPKWP